MSQTLFASFSVKVRAALASVLVLTLFIVTALSAHRTHDEFTKKNAINLEKLEKLKLLQAEAQELNKRPRLNRSTDVTLQSITKKQLDTFANVSTGTDGLEIEVKNAPPEAIAQWLAEVRNSTEFRVTEAHINRNNGRLSGKLKLAE